MTNAAQVVLEQALRLSPVERAELIEELYRSFHGASDPRRDAAWAEEAEARIDAFDKDRLPADSAESVLNRIAGR